MKTILLFVVVSSALALGADPVIDPPSLFGETGDIANGFALGLGVWAVCAGSAWAVKIIKQFASAAS